MVELSIKFEGDVKQFERALTTKDGSFSVIDSIIWELDNGEWRGKGSIHHTVHGDIQITVKKEDGDGR